MLKSTYNISIPEPCHENWQIMSVCEKGTFCNACQKNVHDFTKASDKQIIDAFRNDKNLCGRFLDSQLQRDIFEPKERSTIWLATSSIILSFLALQSNKVSAQVKDNTEQSELKTVKNITNIQNNSEEKVITGIVSDSTNVMPGVNVIVIGTEKGVSTDFDGSYKIKARFGDVLKFSFIGMQEASRIIDNGYI